MAPSDSCDELLAPQLAFGPRACELAPRALAAQSAGSLAVAFATGSLAESDRTALAALPSGRLEGLQAEEARFACERSELEGLAQTNECARVLLTATRNAERSPAGPAIMGVLNVTPDSFSDGGQFLAPERAIAHGLELAAAGAAILDIGGESTRPGAAPVSASDELDRILPVLEGLAGASGAQLSIDTSKSRVAEAALDAGATLVNDVTAGIRDDRMLSLAAERECTIVLMHMQGAPATMQARPIYDDPVREVAEFLRERCDACLKAGISPHRIVLDPGIGFGKRLDHNLELIRRLRELRSLGQPLLLGVSRKSFIGHLTGMEKQEDWQAAGRAARDRVGGTAAAVAACVAGGAEILRVHDVRIMAEAIEVAAALAGRPPLRRGL
jgi:dihydropteroate synthase